VDYYNEYGIINRKTGKEFSDLLGIYVLELPKLPEAPDGRRVWPWGRFFRSLSEEEMLMAAGNDGEIKQAAGVVMELSEDEADRMLAESREIFLWDQRVREEDRYNRGLEKGREETARKLKGMSIPLEKIAEAAGLSLEEVEKL
jgi:predicted transposase/invertase (TIGR01784 family)